MTTASPVSAGILPSLIGARHGDRRLQPLVRRAELGLHLVEDGGCLLGADDAFLDELRRVLLAHGRLRRDLRDHQRLGVGGLVLLVVAEAAVADQVDDDVVAELLPVGHRQPDRGDRRLRIVRVDVDDRDVEALGEVARVPRRAPFRGVGREADLVVGDQVQRAAGRVAVEVGQVERLRHDALAREGRVAVDQDRQRDRGVVDAGAERAVGLLGPRPALDDRVDGLEVAGVRCERDRHLARGGRAGAGRGEVVLDVARAALVVRDDGVDRALALELAQDRLVRAADGVDEHVEAPAMGHADHDLVGAGGGGDLDRLVEHRHHRVETLERELLLAEEGAAEVLLEALGPRDAVEQPHALLGGQRLPVAAGLDRLPEPDALGVVGEVLDLVGDRAAVDLAQGGQRLPQRLAGDVDAEQLGGDARLQLRRERRDQPRLVEGGVAERLRPERVEPRREVPVHPVRLDERHRGGDAAEERLVDLARDGGRGRRALGRSAGARSGASGAAGGWPLPRSSVSSRRSRPGWEATSALSPLSNSSRHSAGTASGFSR